MPSAVSTILNLLCPSDCALFIIILIWSTGWIAPLLSSRLDQISAIEEPLVHEMTGQCNLVME